jgi:hypothetical protein
MRGHVLNQVLSGSARYSMSCIAFRCVVASVGTVKEWGRLPLCSFVTLNPSAHMPRSFTSTMPTICTISLALGSLVLLESIYVQERIIEQMMPAVYMAFKKYTVSTTSYATKWYITLFANSIPFQTHLRLWDAFLLEGPDLFVIVAVSIIWTYRGMWIGRSTELPAYHRGRSHHC